LSACLLWVSAPAGEEVVGLSVNEVLSADGAGSEVSKRDQGRWDADGIVKVRMMNREVSD